VVSEKLTPELAAKKVLAVAAEIPQLSVVGLPGRAMRWLTRPRPSRPSI